MDTQNNDNKKKFEITDGENTKEVTMDLNYYVDYRAGLWKAIRDKESKTWTFLSFAVAAIAAIFAIGFENIPPFLVTMSILLLCVWGLLVVIDSNFWFNRNLKVIVSIEKKINDDDSLGIKIFGPGNLLPEDYQRPAFKYQLNYKTLIRVLNIIILSVVIWYYFTTRDLGANTRVYDIIVMLSTILLLGWVYLEDWRRRQEYIDFWKDTANKEEGSYIDHLKSRSKIYSSRGPVMIAGLTPVLLVLILTMTEWFLPAYVPSWVITGLMILPFGVFIAGVFLDYIFRSGFSIKTKKSLSNQDEE